jgi:hypothetical protein
MLDRIDLTPAALRADLTGSRVAPQRLYATAEVISRAADLCCESTKLVHDNERRWRLTRDRTQQLVQAMTGDTTTADTKTTSTGTANTGTANTGTANTGTADTREASGAGEGAPVSDQESPG